ncbi:F-box protein At3g07870-like [Salvia hispanica]|uniref:F-box protein At3g07870-like n=1 Tax=Salvia hispanica TaxID=49212 RepID=UPI002009731C|nr:F-box protein At3g07870-like [Salvia hispanica]
MKMECDSTTETKEGFYLPEELTREILVKLPIKSVLRFKGVCKSWRDLIEGVDFVKSYTPKPCLVFYCSDTYAVCDVEAFEPLFEFRMFARNRYGNTVHYCIVADSINGLLLVKEIAYNNMLFVCNPITRECVRLPPLPTYCCIVGFGVSKLSGKYKILYGDKFGSCHVCTLGEASWRSISKASPGRPLLDRNIASFSNGNLHWLASDSQKKNFICCFDLETELFTSFSLPPRVYGSNKLREYRLCILEGRLCLCDTFDRYNIVIWLMSNYGDENSWVKKFVFCQRVNKPSWLHNIDSLQLVRPIKVLANGDLLFRNNRLYTYSKESETLASWGDRLAVSTHDYCNIVIYTPSFLSLKAMGIHNVRSLEILSPFYSSFLQEERYDFHKRKRYSII